MKKETVEKILSETRHGYDMISEKFSQTRKHFWRGLEFLENYAKNNDRILDFGCGNGRLLELLGDKKIEYHGVDVSQNLIEAANLKYCENDSNCNSGLDPESRESHRSVSNLDSRLRGNDRNINFKKITGQSSLPFPQEYFNTVYSIAVFHHFPSQKYRQDVANELFRISSGGGHIVVTAWNLWQKKYRKNIFANWFAKVKGQSKLNWNDCHVSFTDNQGKVFSRFHHAFTKRELRKLFESAGFKTEKCELVDGRNILYIGKK